MLKNLTNVQISKEAYLSHMHWNAHVQARENLYYETFISIKD